MRLLAQPPAGLSDGEYWARITVHARDDPSAPFVDTNNVSAARVHISMETATVLPIFFRQGVVSTGVTIGSVRAEAGQDTIDVRATLTRTGNGAFIGVAHILVRDSTGHTVANTDRQLAVYRSMQPRWSIAIPRGSRADGYSVSIRLSTDRQDVPKNLVLQARPVETVVAATYDRAP